MARPKADRDNPEAPSTGAHRFSRFPSPKSGPITEATPEQFTAAFSNHLICDQLLVQTVLPGMKAAGFGRIINIISTSVIAPIAGLGVSNTIRAAVANWGRTLAGELGSFGITVNNVLPGYTDTARLRSLIGVIAERDGILTVPPFAVRASGETTLTSALRLRISTPRLASEMILSVTIEPASKQRINAKRNE